MKKLIFSLFLPLFLGSCAPKVLTHIEKKYPSRIAADEVHLYGVGQTLPETAERIGSVRVVDGGASTKCNYEQVVALAKQETAKNGGNALALTDHRKPSLLGSSCHQIAGDMLWISDTANWETGTVANLSAPVGDKNTTGVAKSAFRHSTFYANVGYAFITSKYYLPSGASGDPKNGMDWQLGYDWVSRSGFGAGLMSLERNITCLTMSGSERTLDTSAVLCRSRTLWIMETRNIPESFVYTLTPECGFISDRQI